MSKSRKDFEILDSGTRKRKAIGITTICVSAALILFIAGYLIVKAKGNPSTESQDSKQDITTVEKTRKSYAQEETSKKDTTSEDTTESVTSEASAKSSESMVEKKESSSERNQSYHKSDSGVSYVSQGKRNLDPESSQPVIETDNHKEDWQNEWTEGEDAIDEVLGKEAENTRVEITYEELIKSLEEQVKTKMDFIASHYGWPEDMGDKGQYDGVRAYIDSIQRSFLTGKIDYNEDGKGLYGEEPETLQRQLMYHLFREQQYYTGYTNCPEATSIYFKWAEFGLADIGKIESIRIMPYQFPIDCEDYTICMEIETVTENGLYIIYVGDMDVENERMYVIMDIELIEEKKEEESGSSTEK